MEGIIPFQKIFMLLGFTKTKPEKRMSPPKVELIHDDRRFIDHEGRRILLNKRDPNESLPQGYLEWVNSMRNDNNCYISRLHEMDELD